MHVGCHGAGKRNFSLSNPTNPSLLRSLSEDDGGKAQGVVADDDFLYVADNYGVEAYNIGNSSSPIEIAEKTNGISAAHDLDIDNDYVHVALGGGLVILELNDVRTIYIPKFFYYTIPIAAVVLGGGIFLVIKLCRRKKL